MHWSVIYDKHWFWCSNNPRSSLQDVPFDTIRSPVLQSFLAFLQRRQYGPCVACLPMTQHTKRCQHTPVFGSHRSAGCWKWPTGLTPQPSPAQRDRKELRQGLSAGSSEFQSLPGSIFRDGSLQDPGPQVTNWKMPTSRIGRRGHTVWCSGVKHIAKNLCQYYL